MITYQETWPVLQTVTSSSKFYPVLFVSLALDDIIIHLSLSLSLCQWSTTPIILNYRYILTFFVNFSARRIIERKTFPFGKVVSFPRPTIERSGIHGYLCAFFQPKRINLPYNYQFEDPLYYNCISIKREFLYIQHTHVSQPITSFILSTKNFYCFV